MRHQPDAELGILYTLLRVFRQNTLFVPSLCTVNSIITVPVTLRSIHLNINLPTGL